MHISSEAPDAPTRREPWNKGKLVGPKPPLTLQQVWEIRIRLQILNRIRDLALFNLAIDSKLGSCDLVRLRVADITHGGRVNRSGFSRHARGVSHPAARNVPAPALVPDFEDVAVMGEAEACATALRCAILLPR